ncbi:MAG TPA: hypothetical protein VGF89_03920 [Steroidobacteraceae bacterium]|jgi:hypothetical protein
MIERLHLSVILLVAAALWGVILLFAGVDVSTQWFQPFSKVLGTLMILLSLFDMWLWKWRIFHPWLVKRPVLNGTWRAELKSNWINPATERGIPPIAGFMVVRQTFSRLSLRLITQESGSEVVGAEVIRSDDGMYSVFGVYRNEPRQSVRHRSAIHYGGMVLKVAGSPPDTMEGHYWTDRNTAGEIILTEHNEKHAGNFSSAQKLYIQR